MNTRSKPGAPRGARRSQDSTRARAIVTRSEKPHSATFAASVRSASGSASTSVACAAPRDSASSPNAPVPA